MNERKHSDCLSWSLGPLLPTRGLPSGSLVACTHVPGGYARRIRCGAGKVGRLYLLKKQAPRVERHKNQRVKHTSFASRSLPKGSTLERSDVATPGPVDGGPFSATTMAVLLLLPCAAGPGCCCRRY